MSNTLNFVIIVFILASGYPGNSRQLPKRSRAVLTTATAVQSSLVQQAIPKPSGAVVRVSDYKGTDLGVRINAADTALGAKKGWIVVDIEGELRTQAHISQGHTLKFASGRFSFINTSTLASSILLESDTAVFGEGINKTVLLEPENAYTVIESGGHAETERGYYASGTRSNIQIAGFTVEGRNTR